MPDKLQDSVVVITGASSGIGRTTALEFAKRGANVVLAARRERLLLEVARECKQLSRRDTLTVPTNVADEVTVENLARAAYEHFGQIDCGSTMRALAQVLPWLPRLCWSGPGSRARVS